MIVWGQIGRTARLEGRKVKKEIQVSEFQTNHINVCTHSSVLSVTKCRRCENASLLCGAVFLCMVEDVVNLLACLLYFTIP